MKWDKLDEENYVRLMEKTNVLHQGNDPNNPHAKSSGGKNGIIYLLIFGILVNFLRKSMRDMELLLFQVILTHC